MDRLQSLHRDIESRIQQARRDQDELRARLFKGRAEYRALLRQVVSLRRLSLFRGQAPSTRKGHLL